LSLQPACFSPILHPYHTIANDFVTMWAYKDSYNFHSYYTRLFVIPDLLDFFLTMWTHRPGITISNRFILNLPHMVLLKNTINVDEKDYNLDQQFLQ